MSSDPKLKNMRTHIDEADRKILDALAERMKVVDEIGKHKKAQDMDIPDAVRESEVISSRVSSGRNRGLDPEMVHKLFEIILDYSKKREGR